MRALSALPPQRPGCASEGCLQPWQPHGLGDLFNIVSSRGGGQHIPLPVRFPPKPPLPRMNTVDWFSKTTFPVALSTVSTIEVTAAAFPLSRTSSTLCAIIRLSEKKRIVQRKQLTQVC